MASDPHRAAEDVDDIDPEGPSAEDLERFGSEFRSCPACGADVYDQAEVCPRCLAPMSAASSNGLPTWAILAACAMLVTFILFWVL